MVSPATTIHAYCLHNVPGIWRDRTLWSGYGSVLTKIIYFHTNDDIFSTRIIQIRLRLGGRAKWCNFKPDIIYELLKYDERMKKMKYHIRQGFSGCFCNLGYRLAPRNAQRWAAPILFQEYLQINANQGFKWSKQSLFRSLQLGLLASMTHNKNISNP